MQLSVVRSANIQLPCFSPFLPTYIQRLSICLQAGRSKLDVFRESLAPLPPLPNLHSRIISTTKGPRTLSTRTPPPLLSPTPRHANYEQPQPALLTYKRCRPVAELRKQRPEWQCKSRNEWERRACAYGAAQPHLERAFCSNAAGGLWRRRHERLPGRS